MLAVVLGGAQPDFEVRSGVQRAQEFLLVLVGLGVVVRIPENIVVIRPKMRSAVGKLFGKRSEINVEPIAIFFEAVIEIAAVDEDRNPSVIVIFMLVFVAIGQYSVSVAWRMCAGT